MGVKRGSIYHTTSKYTCYKLIKISRKLIPMTRRLGVASLEKVNCYMTMFGPAKEFEGYIKYRRGGGVDRVLSDLMLIFEFLAAMLLCNSNCSSVSPSEI